ncbi:AI-2E family transporter [uncultured Faecalibaculum sp.]|uniref:AI-2E family transporter n=1 Tax=uncultured Faecalibaculum sp. TaxID=1729681 RepID=UPI0025E4D632|nr:AI-2E family transporter [uncultured Faecalibaculum sp.]
MFHLDKQYRNREILIQRLILFALGLGMVILYFRQILDFFGHIISICMPFIVGGFLGYVLNVLATNLLTWGQRLFGMKVNRFTRFLCNCLAILTLLLLVVVFLFVLFPRIAESLRSFMIDLPASLNAFWLWLLKITENMPSIHDWISQLDFSVDSLSRSTEEFLVWINADAQADLMSSVYNALTSAFSWAFNCMMSVMFAIILLFNKQRVVHEGRSFLEAYIPERFLSRCIHILKLIDNTFTGYIGGSCLECLILGTLVGVFSAIIGLPYALLSGLVVGIGALVPMFGALTAALLVALFMALESPANGLYFMILFICIQQVEGNFIYPHVMGKTVGLPPFYVMIAITIGANVAGILGMIVFIPITSCIYQIIREDAAWRLARKRKQAEGQQPEAGENHHV